MKVVVYCGASFGENPIYQQAAEKLGAWIGKNHHTLVYGGGKMGLMGSVAGSTLEHGGKVIGVIPSFLKEREIAHPNLSEIVEVENMSVRKAKMAELGDLFIALPGGPGTLEEISEMISWSRIGQNNAPCVLFNVNRYYDSLVAFYETMVKEGFYTKSDWEHVLVTDEVAELLPFVENYQAPKFREY